MIVNKQIDGGNGFDWGKTSNDYAQFRDIYPAEFYKRIVDLGLCVKGQRVLDLGTGTGVLPRNMYRYGADFTGADISENQIAQAVRLSKEKQMDIKYIVAAAEDVSFPDESFNVITACQCFLYFDQAVVLPNIHRMLAAGGRFCMLFMAWLPEENRIAKASEELVLKYNPSWTGAYIRRLPVEAPILSKDLFDVEHAIAYDSNVRFTRESWHGRMRACRGIGASLSDGQISEFNVEHMDLLQSIAPDSFDILHYVTVLVLKKKPF